MLKQAVAAHTRAQGFKSRPLRAAPLSNCNIPPPFLHQPPNPKPQAPKAATGSAPPTHTMKLFSTTVLAFAFLGAALTAAATESATTKKGTCVRV
jgi:hypothetical protein